MTAIVRYYATSTTVYASGIIALPHYHELRYRSTTLKHNYVNGATTLPAILHYQYYYATSNTTLPTLLGYQGYYATSTAIVVPF